MAFEKRYDESLPITEPPCVHLRSKAMYVTGDLQVSEHADEEGSHYHWCNQTQHILGPDKQDVARSCCTPGRGCFCETR